MNRRGFFKSLLGTVAFVGAVKLGLGNVTAADVPVKGPTYLIRDKTFTETVVLNDATAFYRFENCRFYAPDGSPAIQSLSTTGAEIEECDFRPGAAIVWR